MTGMGKLLMAAGAVLLIAGFLLQFIKVVNCRAILL
ncbi:hypothetical protein MEZE111188_10945 [Mesobacillus zeae]